MKKVKLCTDFESNKLIQVSLANVEELSDFLMATTHKDIIDEYNEEVDRLYQRRI